LPQSLFFAVAASWQNPNLILSNLSLLTLRPHLLKILIAVFSTSSISDVLVSNVVSDVTTAPALLMVNPAGVAIGLYPGLTIDGVVGKTYGIQYSPSVTATNTWTTLTNLVLSQPVQLWLDTSVDTSSGVQPQRYYRVVPIR